MNTIAKKWRPHFLALSPPKRGCECFFYWGDPTWRSTADSSTVYRAPLTFGDGKDDGLGYGVNYLNSQPEYGHPQGIAIGDHDFGYVIWGGKHSPYALYAFDVRHNVAQSSLVQLGGGHPISAGAVPLAVYSHQSTKKGRIDSVFYLDAEHGLSAINIAFRRLASGTNSAGISLTVSEPIKLCDPSPNEITALFVAKKSRMLYWSAVERSKPSPGVPTERLHSFIAKASIAHDPHCMAACFQQTMQCIEIANIGPAAIAVVDE